jgi:hypothetical protein
LLVSLAALLSAALLPLLAGPAAAAELLQATPAGCGKVTVTGRGLTPSASVTVSVANGQSGTRLGQLTAVTDGAGNFTAAVPAKLAGVSALEATASAGGRVLITASAELDAATRKACGSATSSLPFTGPGSVLILLGAGTLLVAGGFLIRLNAAYRGRHAV